MSKRVLQQELIFNVPYNRFDEVDHYLKTNNVFIANTEYGVDVTIHIFLDNDNQAPVKNDLTNLLSGQITFKKGVKRYNEIPVEIIIIMNNKSAWLGQTLLLFIIFSILFCFQLIWLFIT